ncbi:Diaminobutyrate--2-oxoglutarate aminotransferase [compost metagenome]
MIDLIQKENIVANAAEIGAYLVDQFRAQLVEQNVIVRGFGMMIGIELPKDCAELVNIARDKHHLIINVTSGNVVRLLPALNMNHQQADDLLKRLVPAIKEFLA